MSPAYVKFDSVASSAQMAPPTALSSIPPIQHGMSCSAQSDWMSREAERPPTRATLTLTTLQLPSRIAAWTCARLCALSSRQIGVSIARCRSAWLIRLIPSSASGCSIMAS